LRRSQRYFAISPSSSGGGEEQRQRQRQQRHHHHRQKPSLKSIEKATLKWLDQFIIEKNVCPFAKNVRGGEGGEEEEEVLEAKKKKKKKQTGIKIVVSEREQIEDVLEDFMRELKEIEYDSDEEGITKTVLFVISPTCEFVNDFDSFLDFANVIDDAALQNGDYRGESVLDQLDLRGKVQVVAFHPDFVFAGEKLGDPGAFTNKSPYPLLHILREKDVTEAVRSHPDVKSIPKANVERMREIGNESLKKMLDGLRSL
tara:strand:+ start:2602 stop:3372 length:771 start_codon:yes stop_codon:yes gene_type:complete